MIAVCCLLLDDWTFAWKTTTKSEGSLLRKSRCHKDPAFAGRCKEMDKQSQGLQKKDKLYVNVVSEEELIFGINDVYEERVYSSLKRIKVNNNKRTRNRK